MTFSIHIRPEDDAVLSEGVGKFPAGKENTQHHISVLDTGL
jgi:hypothetical protein